ncbi:hypothetical protein XENOCAPTIV_006819, partial [Xenoophorus captivus]
FNSVCMDCTLTGRWHSFRKRAGPDHGAQLQRILAKKYAMLRKIHTTSRLGLRANSGREYMRLGSSRRSRIGSKPLRFFWITPSLVPTLPSRGARGEKSGKEVERQKRRKRATDGEEVE